MVTSTVVVLVGLVLGWWLYGNKSPAPKSRMRWRRPRRRSGAGCSNRLYIDELYGATVIAFYAWWARVADWLDRRVWGGLVARVTWLLRRCGRSSIVFSIRTGSTEPSTRAAKSCRVRRRSAGARADRARADLSALAGSGGCGAGRDPDLEQPAMSGMPILTLLTALPVLGAVIALFAGQACAWRGDDHDADPLALALVVWMHIPADGSIGLLEQHRLGAFARHRVSPGRGWAGRADAGAVRRS